MSNRDIAKAIFDDCSDDGEVEPSYMIDAIEKALDEKERRVNWKCSEYAVNTLKEALSQNIALRGALELAKQRVVAGRHFPSICPKCDWMVSSEYIGLNEMIDDSETYCQKCNHREPEEIETEPYYARVIADIDKALANPLPMPGILRLAKAVPIASFKLEHFGADAKQAWFNDVKRELKALTPTERAILEGKCE